MIILLGFIVIITLLADIVFQLDALAGVRLFWKGLLLSAVLSLGVLTLDQSPKLRASVLTACPMPVASFTAQQLAQPKPSDIP